MFSTHVETTRISFSMTNHSIPIPQYPRQRALFITKTLHSDFMVQCSQSFHIILWRKHEKWGKTCIVTCGPGILPHRGLLEHTGVSEHIHTARREKECHTNSTTGHGKATEALADCVYLLLVPVEAVFLVVSDGCFVTIVLCEVCTSIQIILHFLFVLHHMLHDLTHGVSKQLPHLCTQPHAQNY